MHQIVQPYNHQSASDIMQSQCRWKDPPPGELLRFVAAATAGFAGADLAALCFAAVHAAVRRAAPALLEQLDQRVAAPPTTDINALGRGSEPPHLPASHRVSPAQEAQQAAAAQAINGRAEGPEDARGLLRNKGDHGQDLRRLPPPVESPVSAAEQPPQSAQETTAAPLEPARQAPALPATMDRQAAQATNGRAAGEDSMLLDSVQVSVLLMGANSRASAGTRAEDIGALSFLRHLTVLPSGDGA